MSVEAIQPSGGPEPRAIVLGCAVVLFTLFVGAGFIAALILAILWIAPRVPTLNQEVTAAIIASSATVLVSVATVMLNQWLSKSREIREAHRQHKVEIYRGFMRDVIVGVLRGVKENSKREDVELDPEMETKLINFTADLIIWGSPPVIRKFRAFKDAPKLRDLPAGVGRDVIERLDSTLLAIRKDLGNSNRGLSEGDLIGMFINKP